MRITVLNRIVGSFTLPLLFMLTPTHAGAASPSLLQAKKEAEAKGYIFFTTHDEIAAIAKKEGKLRVSSGLQSQIFKPLINTFKQKYPFIPDVYVEEIRGRDAQQRFILEMQAGQAKEWDITHIPIDFAQEYPPYLMKHDILGMAKQGVLKIDPRMVHPVERNMVGVTTSITVIPYNRKLISDDKVPVKWEDFLKPEFKGRKFILETRPTEVAALVPAWGLERTLEFARKLAAQQPAWGSSGTRTNTAIAVGEYSLSIGASFDRVKSVMGKDPTGTLSYKVIEPIPTRILNHPSGIINTVAHPHAALLWLEFLASPEGQEIIDKYAPFAASLFTPGSVAEQMTRGKKLSVVDWDHFTKFQGYTENIVAAYGFPKADIK
ncbi:MAG: ABC transporter substrate-binding protein [Deltaproteobacteria bacterium]|nr:ABC transporter substrate-binding protein [Deltaproteobacteria bacterium]